MCKLLKLLLSFALLFVSVYYGYSCTALIITGKLTEDGRPLLLKHRDAAGETGRIQCFQGGRFDIMALIVGEVTKRNVLCGTNTAELSIVNTATYNLGNRRIQGITPSQVMFSALSSCDRLEAFESMLTDLQAADSLIPANFGLIDAFGGAAFYEVGYKTWTKYDVNDKNVAPDGYMVYTNFSRSGNDALRRGFVRYVTACNIIEEAITSKVNITPRWIIDNISRSLRNDLLGIDLYKNNCIPLSMFPDQDMIPNRYTSSSIVFQGCGEKKKENTIMWTVLGYPLTTPVVPLVQGEIISSLFSGEFTVFSDGLKRLAFVRSDSDKYYIRLSFLFDAMNNGVVQRIRSVENEFFLSLGTEEGNYYGNIEKKEKLISDYCHLVEEYVAL